MTSQFFPRQSIGNLFFYETSMPWGDLKGARGQGASPLKCPLFRISKVGNPSLGKSQTKKAQFFLRNSIFRKRFNWTRKKGKKKLFKRLPKQYKENFNFLKRFYLSFSKNFPLYWIYISSSFFCADYKKIIMAMSIFVEKKMENSFSCKLIINKVEK